MATNEENLAVTFGKRSESAVQVQTNIQVTVEAENENKDVTNDLKYVVAPQDTIKIKDMDNSNKCESALVGQNLIKRAEEVDCNLKPEKTELENVVTKNVPVGESTAVSSKYIEKNLGSAVMSLVESQGLNEDTILDHPTKCDSPGQNHVQIAEDVKPSDAKVEASAGSSKTNQMETETDSTEGVNKNLDILSTNAIDKGNYVNPNIQTAEDVKPLEQKQITILKNMKAEDVMKEASEGSSKANEMKMDIVTDLSEKVDKNISDRLSTKVIDKGTQDSLIKKVNKLVISDAPAPMSEVILKNPSEALKHLLVYENSTDEEDEYDDFEKNWQFYAAQSIQETISNQSYSDEVDSESDSVEFLEGGDSVNSDDETSIEAVDLTDDRNKKNPTQSNIPNKNDYMEENHVPAVDVAKLNIDYNKEEFVNIGQVKAIIDTIVTVEAIPDTPAYDLDSVLFVENKTCKRPLGAIFDVIGPVTSPIYCIRFKSRKELDEMELKVGDNVFSAPNSAYTRYVFVKELLRFRGTDASWVGDGELPEELVEISDEEKNAILEDIRQSTRKRKHGSLERHQRFEKSMNKYNTMNSKVYQLVDIQERMDRGLQHISTSTAAPIPHNFRNVPQPVIHHFDPSVPPPAFRGAQPAMFAPSGSTWRGNIPAPRHMQGAFPQMVAVPPPGGIAPMEQMHRFYSPPVMMMVPGQGNSAQYQTNRGSKSKKRSNRGSFTPSEWHY